MIKLLAVAILAALLTSGCSGEANSPVSPIEPAKPHFSDKAAPEYVEGQLIIQFIAGLSDHQHLNILQKNALRMVKVIGSGGRLYLVQIEDDKTVEEKLYELRKVPEISITEPNFISRSND